MAEEQEIDTENSQAEAAKPLIKKGKFDVKRILKPLIIIGSIVVVLGGVFLSPIGSKLFNNKSEEAISEEERAKKAREITYLPLPETVVNIKNPKGKNTFLKASFTLLISNEKEREHINYFVPLINDQFQTYLREMDVEDIQGAAGIERIRQELLIRINQVITPFKVKEVLVKEFLVQ
ncbi:MAG: flagellar basal body-associated FliL family protein [Proteobacteria bacterium]|nr:flagellar basal body-associated FliL family protein [Pseudomonadota bacterium]